MYRIKYWFEDSNGGKWCLSGLMNYQSALEVSKSNIYPKMEIVKDSSFD